MQPTSVPTHRRTRSGARLINSIRFRPRKRPQQARSRALVDALVEATERVLTRSGYEAATTQAIADVAGVSIGSLYQYFPNKEALVAAVVERRTDAIADRVQRRATELCSLTAELALAGWAEALRDALLAERALLESVPGAVRVVDRESYERESLEHCVDVAVALMTVLAQRGQLLEPELTAHRVTSTLIRMIRERMARGPVDVTAGGAWNRQLAAVACSFAATDCPPSSRGRAAG